MEQLIAESTGKEAKGTLPVADEPVGGPDVYGDDRVFVHLRSGGEGEHDSQLGELARAGHPVFTLDAEGPEDLGRIFFFAEFATAVAGWVLGINPFDQPNVQEAKDNTAKVLEQFAAEGALPEVEEGTDEALRELLADAEPPNYVAIMGYVEPSDAFDAAVAELRVAIRDGDPLYDDVRIRAALPPLHGPVPQGRPADRPLPPDRPRRRPRTSRYRRRATRSGRSRTRRRPATCRRCARTACPPSACGWRAIPSRASET